MPLAMSDCLGRCINRDATGHRAPVASIVLDPESDPAAVDVLDDELGAVVVRLRQRARDHGAGPGELSLQVFLVLGDQVGVTAVAVQLAVWHHGVTLRVRQDDLDPVPV